MTVSISNMAQVWMSNTNTYNGIAMSISTLGYGANSNCRILKFSVDGNTKFDIDSNGNIITCNSVNTSVLNVYNRGITYGSMPANSILQIIQTVKTTTFSTQSTSAVDITGMSATITPKFSNSKILVLVDLKWSVYGHGDIYLLRGSTKLYYGDLSGNQTQASLHSYGSGSYGTDYALAAGHISYIDSPSTTNATTYKLQAAVPYSGSYQIAVNYSRPNEDASYNSRLASSITLLEIAQ